MKINFSNVLMSLEGKPIPETTEPDSKGVTLGFVAIQALLGTLRGDEAMEGEEKLKLFQIAEKVADARDKGKEVDFSPEDVVKIKARIGKAFPTALVGPAYKLLH